MRGFGRIERPCADDVAVGRVAHVFVVQIIAVHLKFPIFPRFDAVQVGLGDLVEFGRQIGTLRDFFKCFGGGRVAVVAVQGLRQRHLCHGHIGLLVQGKAEFFDGLGIMAVRARNHGFGQCNRHFFVAVGQAAIQGQQQAHGGRVVGCDGRIKRLFQKCRLLLQFFR